MELKKIIDRVFGKKIRGTRVVPLVLKIVVIFTLFLLASNFISNYFNLMLNRGQHIKLMNQLLVKDLKGIYVFCTNQHEIYSYNLDYEGAVSSITNNALKDLKGEKSITLGVKPDGSTFFLASRTIVFDKLGDSSALEILREARNAGNEEGSIIFRQSNNEFFGVFKYNQKWDVFLIRAEELSEFYQESWKIFKNISILILAITLVCVITGIFLIRYILRFVTVITSSIMKMGEKNRIKLINLDKAPNDDVTYLGIAFNALASTIDNLMIIFRKFVTRDVALKAYKEHDIRLEGDKRDLTILFSDIKGFTYMTEILGTDIINLLNLHYDSAIQHIHKHYGVIGSIIGDALLAIFGAIDAFEGNKSLEAVQSAYDIQDVAAKLRSDMHRRREEIIRARGALTKYEEMIFKAVLIEVGVGIDGGEVFYGTIGSNSRMTSTVIGDTVNSSSRLEGLTRIYKIPVICSVKIKNDIERDNDNYFFLELDQVQVKGKTIGKRIYWPMPKANIDEKLNEDITWFSRGLEAYYEGNWKDAFSFFSNCTLPLSDVFVQRTRNQKCPKGWNGIWTMATK